LRGSIAVHEKWLGRLCTAALLCMTCQVVDVRAAPAAAERHLTVEQANRRAIQLMRARHYGDVITLLEPIVGVGASSRPLQGALLDAAENLAISYSAFGDRQRNAVDAYRRVLSAREAKFGPEHQFTLATAERLANILTVDAQAEQLRLLRRVVQGRERGSDSDPADLYRARSSLGRALFFAGEVNEAETLLRGALEDQRRTSGEATTDWLETSLSLAYLYQVASRYSEAEQLLLQRLAIQQRTEGPDHFRTLAAQQFLASLYLAEGRHQEALTILDRVYEGLSRTVTPSHLNLAQTIDALAEAYSRVGDTKRADIFYRRYIDYWRERSGAEDYMTYLARDSRARALAASRNHVMALPEFGDVLRWRRGAIGALHPFTLQTQAGLAQSMLAAGTSYEGDALLARTAEDQEQTLGAAHLDTLTSNAALVRSRLADSARSGYGWPAAVKLLEGARQRRSQPARSFGEQQQRQRQSEHDVTWFSLAADAAWVRPGRTPEPPPEVFAALQEALVGPANEAIARMAARRLAQGAGGGAGAALPRLIAQRETVEAQWQALQTQRSQALQEGQSALDTLDDLRGRESALNDQLQAIDAQVARDFPEYFDLIRPAPLTIEQARALLKPGDAILLAVPSGFGTHVVALTRDRVSWHRSNWSAERVAAAVRRLRWSAGATVQLTPQQAQSWSAEQRPGAAPAFDRAAAHALYEELIAPASPLLAGTRRLFVAGGGPLSGLPFSLLVAEQPRGRDNDPASLRGTSWLADAYSLVHIPSIQAMAVLRRSGAGALREAPAGGGFAGFGNPQLDGSPTARGPRGGRAVAASAVLQRGRTRSGGAIADVNALRSLAQLPGTARELESVRLALGAPAGTLFMQAAATEPAVRNADLTSARILLFSTHALTTGESGELAEPGLVMTPPDEPSEENDGYLAASEVAALRLDADWVILSACNTATGDGAQGEGLSALSRAFFYAGARNLLASHWPVSDDVAPVLITRTLQLERGGVRRADAFRQAMREVRMDSSHDSATGSWAHPFYWAPFVIIGDGG
jgi:CHAT domain-containing protein